METISLNGIWDLCDTHLSFRGVDRLRVLQNEPPASWIAAVVPGEVHLDLMAAGLMDEPLVGDNAPRCRWPENRAWWYRRSFTVPSDTLHAEHQELWFHGLDLAAQVFLNGEHVAESENAFVPLVVDVTHKLRAGENDLLVRVTAGTELATDAWQPARTPDDIYRNRTFAGVAELRKPQFTYGWDWVDSLPNIGIWRDVEIRAWSGFRLSDFIAKTDLSDDECTLSVQVDVQNIHPWSDRAGTLSVTLTSPKGAEQVVEREFVAPVGIHRERCQLYVKDPELWWPNGMGAQPLYGLRIEISQDGQPVDVVTREIGLRTVAIDRTPLPSGSRFVIRVNGEEVFCRGGNWIPADAIIARVDRSKYERLIGDARDANFTMLRIWGGGVYESDIFYELCNRYGILVWQDFMFACKPYPDDRPFQEAVRRETEMVIRRLRHHPSLALWCANNENTWGFDEWWNDGTPFPSPDLELGGRTLYSKILPEVCLALDPTRPYWPGSPAGGEKPNSESDGDCHWWHNATMNPDITRRYRHEVYDECRARFVSEYGVIGPCHVSSMREFLGTEAIDRTSLAFRLHTNSFEKETTPAAITYHYADAEDLSIDEYVRYGQMFQAVMYGRSLDAIRFRKHDPEDDCAGAMFWMYNDCWGETGWTPVDYYLRRKASYYWIKRAFQPVRAIVRERGGQLVTRVVNDTREAAALTVTRGWVRTDGTDVRLESDSTTVPANGMLEIGRERIPDDRVMRHDSWIYVSYVEGTGVSADPSVWTLKPHRALSIDANPEIRVHVDHTTITLVSDVYCHGVCHPDEGAVVFSDNYFDLVPGVPRMIECVTDEVPELHFSAVAPAPPKR